MQNNTSFNEKLSQVQFILIDLIILVCEQMQINEKTEKNPYPGGNALGAVGVQGLTKNI